MHVVSNTIRESNIGPHEQRRRLTFGIVMVTIALGMVAAQVSLGWSTWWRLVTILPLMGGVLGILQAHKKT